MYLGVIGVTAQGSYMPLPFQTTPGSFPKTTPHPSKSVSVQLSLLGKVAQQRARARALAGAKAKARVRARTVTSTLDSFPGTI